MITFTRTPSRCKYLPIKSSRRTRPWGREVLGNIQAGRAEQREAAEGDGKGWKEEKPPLLSAVSPSTARPHPGLRVLHGEVLLSHLTEEESEAQRGAVTQLGTQSSQGRKERGFLGEAGLG